MVVFGLAAHTVSVVHPVNPAVGQVVQRQAVFQPLGPMPRRGDNLRLDLDRVSGRQPKFLSVQANKKGKLVVNIGHVVRYQDWML
jgi:hypothetical protein